MEGEVYGWANFRKICQGTFVREKTVKEGADLDVAINGLDTVQGPLAVDDDEWYAIDTIRSSSLDHLFHAV